MSEWLTKFLQAFIPLFVAIDPIGLYRSLGIRKNLIGKRGSKSVATGL